MFRQWLVMSLTVVGAGFLVLGCANPQATSDAQTEAAEVADVPVPEQADDGEPAQEAQTADELEGASGEDADKQAAAQRAHEIRKEALKRRKLPDESATPAPIPDKIDQQVGIALHETFSIELKSNPSTGFRWEVETNSPGLKLLGQTGKPGEHCKDGMVGCGGYTIFEYEAQQAGESFLVFRYVRPWVEDKTQAQRHTVRVLVE